MNIYHIPLVVVFVSGWGIGARLWTLVQTELAYGISSLELAFITLELGDSVLHETIPPSSFRLVIGHSSGFLWLLQKRPIVWDGLVAVNSFTRFVSGRDFPHGVPIHLLKQMLYQFDRDPVTVMTAFLRRCGCDNMPEVALSSPSWLLLRQWLEWLCTGDTRAAFAVEKAPLLVLAGRADRIVPPAMTEACFAGRDDVEIAWQLAGGHLLPLSHPAWLAECVRAFIQRIKRTASFRVLSALEEAR